MSIYSEATTKKYNRVLLAGSSLCIIQAYQVKITSIPLIGLSNLDPNLTKILLAFILLLTLLSFTFSYFSSDFQKGIEESFFKPILEAVRGDEPFNTQYRKALLALVKEGAVSSFGMEFMQNGTASSKVFGFLPMVKIFSFNLLYISLIIASKLQFISVFVFLCAAIVTILNFWPNFLVFIPIDELPFCMNPSPIRLG